MSRLTNGQRSGLDALCRLIIPAAFDDAATSDIAVLVESRIFDLPPFHRKRALLALSLWRLLPRKFYFESVRRLILHTHYGRTEKRAQSYPWEGPLRDALPVVAPQARERERERVVPVGVFERPPHDHLRAEFCIVGSGVGGAMAAAVLAEAGHDVVVLEEGGYYTPSDYSDDENSALRTLYADGGLRTTDSLNVSILQGRCAGGGSTVNWMVMLRTPEHVLDEWRTHHGFDISPTEMNAAFERFEQDSSVAEVADHAHSPINRLILDSARALGWQAQAAKVNAHDCVRAGTCGQGCKYGAKRGALHTYLMRACAAGARLYCNARVDRIEQGRVHAGAIAIECDKIILAAGGIATPALLQRSGLGNGEVGKHLRLHPTTAVVGIYDRPFYAAGGIPLTSYCNEFSDLRHGYGHWIESPPLSPGLAAIALPGFGARHRAYMEQFPFLAPLIVLVRDGEPSAPSIGRVRARRNDISISYRLGRSDRAALDHGIASTTRMHRESGAREILTLRPDGAPNRDPALFSAHVNGTCRISRNAREGASLPDGKVRGCSGVYVLDGSLLPTAPGVNPHETIAAVTMILAERLK